MLAEKLDAVFPPIFHYQYSTNMRTGTVGTYAAQGNISSAISDPPA
jgi:hypothetical protein